MDAIAFSNRDTLTMGVAKPGVVRVALLVGDNRTLHCGVKDYAITLAKALRNIGVEADVFAPETWGIRSLPALRKKLRDGAYDIVHLQYPSVGCRYSLLPHLLGLLRFTKAAAVTLHEHSVLPFSQRTSLQIFRWTYSSIIWATDYEYASFNASLGMLGASQQVIPIGSNIPAAPVTAERDRTVVYFGQIRSNKGLEDFIALADLSTRARTPFRFLIAGSASLANQAYVAALHETTSKQVEWVFDLSFEEVSSLLSRSFAAYLPFPDGASERRGSMLAALSNGLPVLSSLGPATTASLADVIFPVVTPDEALSMLNKLADNPSLYAQVSDKSRQYMERNQWTTIAKRHRDVYDDFLFKVRAGA